jgi:2-polyprenyl-6-methoxyphenol hydroxylase-like FAD-dependent oxidoreductase
MATSSKKTQANGRSVLISGASIAGPTLAYWLHSYGFRVAVFEKSAAIRKGGYAIDVRGDAVEVSERMGIGEALKAAALGPRTLHFVDQTGENHISILSDLLTGARVGRDIELPRGALTAAIYALTRDAVDYRFNAFITRLTDGSEGVDVTFGDGATERFDLVIGADGLHSNVRSLVFGAESQFDYNTGYCFAGFDVPNTLGLRNEALVANRPGQLLTIVAAGENQQLNVFFNMIHPPITRTEGDSPEFQKRLIRESFAGWGWLGPKMLDAMDRADDLYFDEIKQIRMPAYSKGRVVLVGDAAYAPSFLTGQGSSMAIVGAYVLASELALNADHPNAYAAYDRIMRPFVLANQARLKEGESAMTPKTQAGIDARNAWLAALTEAPPAEGRPEHSMVDLSPYLKIEGS